jgi:hypothetical protein
MAEKSPLFTRAAATPVETARDQIVTRLRHDES